MITTSIRKFLLFNLLIAITVTTIITAIGNYYVDERDIQEHLDVIMAVSALSYQALLGDDIHQRPIQDIQASLNRIPEELNQYFKNNLQQTELPKHYLDNFSLQVLNKEGKIILRSNAAPKEPMSTTQVGFKDKLLGNNEWRVFTALNSKANTHTVLAERYDERKELGQLITKDYLYIMILTFPLSGLLIWFIIGRGLNSLERVAKEVSNREPSHLEPVNIKSVPKEILPVIDELNMLFRRLQEGFEREKRFAADAAHELRTPLAAIKAQAQVALNTGNIDEKNAALEKLIASVNRSTHVVNQLLTISKLVPEASGINDFNKLDLLSITQDILAMLAPAAIEKHIELELDYIKPIPKINGNATAISILIRNLVDNAIRYTHPNGFIHVCIYTTEKEVVLEVKDNGPGIPDDHRTRVFERFFRIIGNPSPGSGLGLGIVQQICKLHHADITLDNPDEGTGLVVRVFFPCPQLEKKVLKQK